jgi:predicted glycoside hydrolase/deacetylase ChbG (UPF0249 family)
VYFESVHNNPAARRLPLVLLLFTLIAVLFAAGQQSPTTPAAPGAKPSATSENLAARLGYPPDARMVIIHADDAGVTHSVDTAIERAFAAGAISSSSILVPAPWFGEIAEFAREHPQDDFGIHLDLTAEWKYLRWRGVAPSDTVPSLLDPDNYFWHSCDEVAAHADADQAAIELRAQVERARRFGIHFSHLDTHMGAVFTTPELARLYLRLGAENHLPLLLRHLQPDDPPYLQRLAPLLKNNPNIFLSNIVQFDRGPVSTFAARYRQVLAGLRPGELTQIIIHPGVDGPELRAAMGDGAYGASWRQADFNAFTSRTMKDYIRVHKIRLVTWRQLDALVQ